MLLQFSDTVEESSDVGVVAQRHVEDEEGRYMEELAVSNPAGGPPDLDATDTTTIRDDNISLLDSCNSR